VLARAPVLAGTPLLTGVLELPDTPARAGPTAPGDVLAAAVDVPPTATLAGLFLLPVVAASELEPLREVAPAAPATLAGTAAAVALELPVGRALPVARAFPVARAPAMAAALPVGALDAVPRATWAPFVPSSRGGAPGSEAPNRISGSSSSAGIIMVRTSPESAGASGVAGPEAGEGAEGAEAIEAAGDAGDAGNA
jgi:hypothetical protein